MFSATFEGGATYSTNLPPGRTNGRSIELFGGNNDRVNIGSRPELGGLKSFTVTTWIKPKAFDAGKTYPRIIEAGNSWILNLANTGDANTNKAGVYLAHTNTTWFSNHRFAFGEWKFLAVTYDGTVAADNLKFYVGDGANLALDATHSAGTGVVAAASGSSYIGANAGTARNLNGLIDDLRVYGMYESAGGVLSSQQIHQIMLQTDTEPADISWIPSGDLYVAHGPDTNSRIRQYAVANGTATFVQDLVTGINYARGLDRMLDGNLVVAERDSSRLLKGTNGLAPGSFPVFAAGLNKPRGVTVRPDNGHVYAAEHENGEVSWYDTNGTYVGKFTYGPFAHEIAFADENEMYVVGGDYAKRYDWTGSAWSNVWSVNLSGGGGMMAKVVNGRLYVTVNVAPSRIIRLDRTNGAVLSSWFGGGSVSGGNYTLTPFTADSRGNLYISDWVGSSLLVIKVDDNGDCVDFRRLATGILANPGWSVGVWRRSEGTVITIK